MNRMTDLDLDGLEAAARALNDAEGRCAWDEWENLEQDEIRNVAEAAVRAYLAASAPSPSSSGWTPTSDGPEPIEYECELCGGRLDGPYEKCGSAQHGPNGTVIYGRAVPVSPIPDSEFTGNPWRDAFPPGRLDAPLKAEAYEQGWDNGRAAENARIVAALRAKGTHAADVLADQIEREAP